MSAFTDRGPATSEREVGSFMVSVSGEPVDDAWDDFLERAPAGHHAQTSAWGRARASIDWIPARIVVRENGAVVAGAQMVRRPMPAAGNVGFVHRGPVVPEDRPELAALVFDELLALGTACGVAYLVVQPPPGGQWMTAELERRGFRCGAFDIDMTATLRLDLRQSLDDLLADMDKKRRQHIRSAQTRGVVVRHGTEADLAVFNHLKDLHSARLGYPRRSPEYYTEVWRALAPRGHIELFIAEYDGEPVAAELAIPFGDTVRHMERPWSGRFSDLRPTQLIEWEAMKWAKAAGYHFTDLEGVDTPIADAVIAGIEPPRDPEYSASLFKIQYGGRIVVDPSSYDYVYNPVLRFLYHRIPVRVLRSAWMRRLLFMFRETGS